MKLRDIITSLDKSDKNSDYVDTSEIASELGIDFYIPYVEQTRLKSYWIANHICTDTWVGYRAYFLDDQCVAVSYQPARKSQEVYNWISNEAYRTTRDFVLSLHQDEVPEPELIDLDVDFIDYYSVGYSCQLLTKDVIYEGKPAVVKQRLKQEYTKPDVIITIDGEELEVYAKDLQIPLNLIDEKGK